MRMTLIFLMAQLVFLSSCSTVHYQGSGRIPVHVLKDESKGLRRAVAVDIERDYYLWGLFPKETVIEVDKEVMNVLGVTGLESIQVYEYRSFKNMLISWITFGLYLPTDYLIKGVGKYRSSRKLRREI